METDVAVRQAVYGHFVSTGAAPTVASLASSLGLTTRDMAAALQRLFERRVLVLSPDGEQILMAPPFSGISTQHHVLTGGREYFANCAWDAFGVLAALQQDGLIRSRCEQTREPLDIPVHTTGPESILCTVHFAVPAALWWRDIVFT